MGDFMEKLPSNVFIDKVATGVGATSMALVAKEKFIIAVPYKALADNKAEWCKEKDIDVLVVKSGVSLEKIKNFKGNKILVVFDSLHKLIEHLPEYSSFRLMVDEVHVVLTSALYRGSGMHSILDNFKKFKDFVLITATPTTILHDINEFRNIKKIRIEWPDNKPIIFSRDIVTQYDVYNIADLVILICKEHLENPISSNAYFFVNSVKFILMVVRALKKLELITHNNVNIIAASGNESKIRLNIGAEYELGKPPKGTESAKKLNFITSTGFEGQDFYDSNGKIYIVSDGSKSHTKLDILTQIPQISGRIRDSKLNDTIKIITKPSVISNEVSEEKYINFIQKEYNDKKIYLEGQNSVLEAQKKLPSVYEMTYNALQKTASDDPLLFVDNDGVIKINKLYSKAKLHEWKVLHQSLIVVKNKDTGRYEIKEGENHSIKYIDEKTNVPPEAIGKSLLGKPYSFKDLCLLSIQTLDKFEENITGNSIGYPNRISTHNLVADIEQEDVIFIDAYYILGATEMRRLEYKRSAIDFAIANHHTVSDIAKAIVIETGEWYSNSEIKLILREAYELLGVKKNILATDIDKYYETVRRRKMVGGVRTHGYYIDSKKWS